MFSEVWHQLTVFQLILLLVGAAGALFVVRSMFKARKAPPMRARKVMEQTAAVAPAPSPTPEAAKTPARNTSLREDITILSSADKGLQKQSTRSKIAPKLLYASTVKRPEATVRVGISTTECEAVTAALRQRGYEAVAIAKARVVIATITMGSLIDVAKLPGVSYVEETVLDQAAAQ
jgi:hypothetical protein